MHYIIDREMSITHDEFFRILPGALKKRNYEIVNNTVFVDLNSGKLKISLSSQNQRNIGSLQIPVTQVIFEFADCSEKCRIAFFEDFDLAYQRGGG